MPNMSAFAAVDRRRKTRFPIELGARYTVHARQELEGKALTVNISSRGVLMRAAHVLPPHVSISVIIEWPVLIDHAGPLALHLYGTVMRSGSGLIAIQFSTYELRTRIKPPERQRQVPNLRTRLSK